MTDDLQEIPGVGPAIAEQLIEAGYDSYTGIAVASPHELSKTANFDPDTAADVIESAREVADFDGFDSGSDVLSKRDDIGTLRTGHDGFDDLLDGGIKTQSVTEVYGNEGSGRTALAHLLAVRAQLPANQGGLSGQVAYIDTRGLFNPDRITEIVGSLPDAERDALFHQHGISGDDLDDLVGAVLDHIHVSEPADSTAQLLDVEQAQELAEKLSGIENSLRLVVMDSLTFHFRAEYQSRGELAERQQKLNKHIHDLMRIADLHNAAIVVTNATTSSSTPYGGNLLRHFVTYRVQFKKTSGDVRYAELADAPDIPVGEDVQFYFTNGQFVPEPST